MPGKVMTGAEAAEFRRKVFGDPDGGAQMVVSSSLARDMKRYYDKKKAEEEAQASAEAEASAAAVSPETGFATDS